MGRFIVRAPVEQYSGVRAGVRFVDGVAEVDDSNEAAARALAYFRRRGYEIEPAGGSKGKSKAGKGKAAGDGSGGDPAGPPDGSDTATGE